MTFIKKSLLILGFIRSATLISNPEVSVILTVFNKEHQIDKVINGILQNTTSPYELVIIYDGCTDRSEEIATELLANQGWPLEKLTILHTPDINETRSNNAGMKAACGNYFILVQDDMQILQKGWEQRLIRPMKVFPDIFAVSARWAASYHPFTEEGRKYVNSFTPKKQTNIVGIRDVVNRGPLALDAAVMKELNYLDEAYAPLFLDDHDLCVRAYKNLHKVAGAYRIEYKQLKGTTHRSLLRKIVRSLGRYTLSTGENWKDITRRNSIIFFNRYKDYFSSDRIRHDENREMPRLKPRPKKDKIHNLLDPAELDSSREHHGV